MAVMKFRGRICGCTPRDDGRFSVLVQESDLSDAVKFYVHDLAKNFDSKAAGRSYRARSIACPYVPGVGYYSFPIDADKAGRFQQIGGLVDVEIEVSVIHNVNFSDKNNRWFTSNDMRYELAKISPVSEKGGAQANEEPPKSGK